MARCPSHDDRNPSLSIAEGEDGRALLCCHSDKGCTTERIVAALGLKMADLMPEELQIRLSDAPRRARPKATTYPTARDAVAELERRYGPRSGLWTYHNAKGAPVGAVVRWDRPDGGKHYRPVSHNGRGWAIAGMSPPRPLYGLPDLLKGNGRIYIAEGEKVADAARSIGLKATTSPHGAKSPEKADWAPLAGRGCVILPDNDDAGWKYAETLAGILHKLRPVPVIKIVTLPDLPPGGDIVEFIAARRAVGSGDSAIAAEIEALAKRTPPAEVDRARLHVEHFRPFPVDALPEPVRGFVSAGAKAIGCDASYIALPILSALASAIGNTRRIELKRGWTEPAIVWAAIVGESGTMKSPALELALRAVRKRQHRGMKEHAEAMERHREDLLRYERDAGHWRRSKDAGEPPQKPEEPVANRCWCDDTTVEALAVLLLNQPRGLLMVRDELSGWLGSFDRYAHGKGGDVAKWLEMFGGRSMIVDRKTAGALYVPRAAVSIAGGIQPDTLRRALGREHRENGLAARLLLAWPTRRPKRWTDADIPPETEAAVEAVFSRLYGLQPVFDDNGDPCPVIVGLTPQGKRAWIGFYNDHAEEQAQLTGDLSAAWSKLEGYAARLALVVHFVRWAAQDRTLANSEAVEEASVAAGIELSRWFKHEARRLYAMLGESEEDRQHRQLVELIRRKGGSATPRELMRSSRIFKTATEAEVALDELAKVGLGRWEDALTTAKGGRPTRRLTLVDDVDVDKTPSKPKENVGCVNVNGVNGAGQSGPRDRAARLMREVRKAGHRGQAIALRDAWRERLAVCEVEGGLSAEEAEKTAEKELNALALSISIA